MRRLTPLEQAKILIEHNDPLEYICGKWYYKKEEIQNIDRFLLNYNFLQFKYMRDVDEFKDCYIGLVGDLDGKWYDNEIILKAKEDEPLKPLAFPLDDKQLTIINVLLFRPAEEVFFITTGVGGSGKSTFGNIVCQLFQNDVSHASLSDLSDGYVLAECLGKRLIYGSELSSDYIENKVIKQLVSKEHMTINGKFQTPRTVKTQSNLLFNCNNPPRMDLTDTGLLRRVIYYCRDTKIVNPDLSIRDKIYSKDELINIARTAYKMDMTDWREKFERETHRQLLKYNSAFICYSDDYDTYKTKCHNKGYKAFNEENWKAMNELIKEWNIPVLAEIKTDLLPY